MIVGGILPYVSMVVFVVAMAYRIRSWRRLPSPPMTLFPAPPPEGRAGAVNTVKEALLFRSLYRGDRGLWIPAWGFHVVLALIFLGHIRVVSNVDRLFQSVGMTEAGIQAMSGSTGGLAGVLILGAAVVLLVRRMVIPRVKEVTGFADLFALTLVGAILITGNVMRFGGEHFDLTLTREYFANLATFRGVGDAAVLDNPVFLAHMGLAFLLLMYIPFSKILHLGGIFFTHQLIRKH